MWMLIATLFFYYAVVFAIAALRLRRQTASEYITAPNRTGFFALTISLLGTIVGGGMFLGVAEQGFQHGVAASTLSIAYLIASIVFGWLAPSIRAYTRRVGATTLLGVFDAIYPAKGGLRVSTLVAWATFLVFILMLAVQFVGIGSFVSYFLQTQFDTAVMIGAAIVAAIGIPVYTAFGGFRRDIITDVVQMVVVTAGVTIVFVSIGPGAIYNGLASLPEEVYTFKGGNAVFFVGALFFVAPTFFMRFDLWQRAVTAKSDRRAKWAFIVSGIVAVGFFVAFTLLGMYGRAAAPNADGRFAAIEVTHQATSGLLYAISTAAFFAAVMSSADTFLGVAGLGLARGVFYRKGEMETADQSGVQVRKLRLATFMAGALGILLALLFRDIMDLFASAFGVLLVFLPSLAGGILRKHPGRIECWWSIGIGMCVLGPCAFFIPTEAFLPGFLAATLAYIIVAKIVGGKALAAEG